MDLELTLLGNFHHGGEDVTVNVSLHLAGGRLNLRDTKIERSLDGPFNESTEIFQKLVSVSRDGCCWGCLCGNVATLKLRWKGKEHRWVAGVAENHNFHAVPSPPQLRRWAIGPSYSTSTSCGEFETSKIWGKYLNAHLPLHESLVFISGT